MFSTTTIRGTPEEGLVGSSCCSGAGLRSGRWTTSRCSATAACRTWIYPTGRTSPRTSETEREGERGQRTEHRGSTVFCACASGGVFLLRIPKVEPGLAHTHNYASGRQAPPRYSRANLVSTAWTRRQVNVFLASVETWTMHAAGVRRGC